MRTSRAHIAGVGISGPNNADGSAASRAHLSQLAVTAATKALLDAGITWTSVDQCVLCFDGSARIPPACVEIFGETGTAIAQVDNKAGFFTTVQFIRSGQKQCALMIATDGDAFAVGIVAVSDLFLTSHAYLKDSAIHIRACSQIGCIRMRTSNESSSLRTSRTAVQSALQYASLSPQDIQILSIAGNATTTTTKRLELGELDHANRQKQPQSLGQVTGSTGLTSLCGLVWQLRGWAASDSSSKVRNCLQHTIHDDGTNTVFVLCRSDGQEAPEWMAVRDFRDGRERLGYNPASEMRQVSQEDVAAVRADKAFTGGENVKRLKLPVKGGDRAALARL